MFVSGIHELCRSSRGFDHDLHVVCFVSCEFARCEIAICEVIRCEVSICDIVRCHFCMVYPFASRAYPGNIGHSLNLGCR